MANKWNLSGVSVDSQDNMTIGGDLTITGTITVPTNANTNFRINSSGVLQIKNVTDSKYHDIYIQDDVGVATLYISETGES